MLGTHIERSLSGVQFHGAGLWKDRQETETWWLARWGHKLVTLNKTRQEDTEAHRLTQTIWHKGADSFQLVATLDRWKFDTPVSAHTLNTWNHHREPVTLVPNAGAIQLPDISACLLVSELGVCVLRYSYLIGLTGSQTLRLWQSLSTVSLQPDSPSCFHEVSVHRGWIWATGGEVGYTCDPPLSLRLASLACSPAAVIANSWTDWLLQLMLLSWITAMTLCHVTMFYFPIVCVFTLQVSLSGAAGSRCATTTCIHNNHPIALTHFISLLVLSLFLFLGQLTTKST